MEDQRPNLTNLSQYWWFKFEPLVVGSLAAQLKFLNSVSKLLKDKITFSVQLNRFLNLKKVKISFVLKLSRLNFRNSSPFLYCKKRNDIKTYTHLKLKSLYR